jgi:hypothetical protein
MAAPHVQEIDVERADARRLEDKERILDYIRYNSRQTCNHVNFG